MNYLDLAQPWLEWETDLREEDQYYCYVEGQDDALTLETPQEPDDYFYMMGWNDTLKKISTGEIKPKVINRHHTDEKFYTDEEF